MLNSNRKCRIVAVNDIERIQTAAFWVNKQYGINTDEFLKLATLKNFLNTVDNFSQDGKRVWKKEDKQWIVHLTPDGEPVEIRFVPGEISL